MIVSRYCAFPFFWVLLAVSVQSVSAIVPFPSIQTPSDLLEVSTALDTFTSAVLYIAGDPSPFEVYVPPVTLTHPPPRSVLIGAEEPPLVSIVRSDAFVVPPKVVMIPPLQLPVVVIVVPDILTVVPSPEAFVFPLFDP